MLVNEIISLVEASAVPSLSAGKGASAAVFVAAKRANAQKLIIRRTTLFLFTR
jgi:hypothetical protein